MTEHYQSEDWVTLYKSALAELEQPKMARRINAAQEAIVVRMGELQTLPGLHPEECRAIENALHALSFLKQEASHLDAERRAVEQSSQNPRRYP